jgi:hypothetical protein
MSESFELSRLGPEAFENIVNHLALRVLGLGSNSFGPGPDGGRDGYFEGETRYPSDTNRWKGIWYIQSKFHRPHLSNNPQKWLIRQIESEVKVFKDRQSHRTWPDNWIIATNIDLSGKAQTGSYDVINKILKRSNLEQRVNVHIWNGKKIVQLIALNPEVAKYYGHFLTPGHVISEIYSQLSDQRASISEILRYFLVNQFTEHTFTKLDQASSTSDLRPHVQDLFIDLPYSASDGARGVGILAELGKAVAHCHRYSYRKQIPTSWSGWSRRLRRARVVLIKGGPGQGKSTVGQYLAQIHRASLLLVHDAPAVNDEVLNVAAAVRSKAERDGFWPTSPRIPVQIELKEFAQWYAERKEEHRGVLAYLAQKLTKKLGSEVLAKTLKRVLMYESWIFIFDGLDEVPNDHKDAIAGEVMNFINDTLVEIDADVLAICTSRPQGYSGQFAGIEGPVVDLLQLDSDTALKCAEPLLRIGRGADEAEKFITILQSAIHSPGVKELMTTPLQAHIMAIVVRDGGRPPERRWQLFNSFYQVMKKRESLKDFQDKRVAHLLREEDRLLRSVHKRLGFVLHGRAERSDGAQTTLSKEEFRSLVRDVVTELVESNVDETVAGVMEATTERLVLVSTPEDGDHVRFDIRQLQEFFAAEFLYAGVDAGELASRVETIGGDAHWREVMHFLLSALIENQNAAYLALSVQVLRRINEGEGPSGAALFSRRMGRAAFLALRLLTEGVLEQDQRDRQQLRPLLDPIGGLLDLGALQPLSKLRPPRSREWLIQLMLDRLSTASPQEYVGALFLLGWMLPPEGSELADWAFNNLPIHLQESLMRHWSPPELDFFWRDGSSRQEERLSPWVVRVSLGLLNSDRWHLYSAETLRIAMYFCASLCHSDETKFRSIAGGCFDARRADTVTLLVKPFRRPSTPRGSHVKRVNCGVLTAETFPADWTNGRVPEDFRQIDRTLTLDQFNGAFRLMLACILFAQTRTAEMLKAVVSLIDQGGCDRTATLPGTILALLPVPNIYATNPCSVAHLSGLSDPVDKKLKRVANEIQPHFSSLLHESEVTDSEDCWRLFAARLPRFAASSAFDPTHMPWTQRIHFVPELKAAIASMPELAASRILKWGALEEHAPELLGQLKQSIRVVPSIDGGIWFKSGSRVSPFEVRLPEDGSLLPVVAGVVVNRFVQEGRPQWHSRERKLLSLRGMLSEFGLDERSLREFWQDSSHGNQQRAGAAALYWLLQSEPESDQPGANMNVDIWRTKVLYGELVTDENRAWLTAALVHGVLAESGEVEPGVMDVVHELVSELDSRSENRDALAKLFSTWRERSSAPVSSRQMMERWLGYRFQIPTYACLS